MALRDDFTDASPQATDHAAHHNAVAAAINSLDAVDNTADTDKPVSAAQQAAITAASVTDRDRANHTGTQPPATVGLGAVDNTADLVKPVSTAQQAAVDAASTLDRARANHTGTQLAVTVSDFSTAADARISAQKGAASGLAPLDAGSKIASAYLPAIAITSVFTVGSQAAQLALTAEEGDVAVRTDLGQTYIHNAGTAGTMADWTLLATPTDVVTSVAGRGGVVVLVKADVGLSSVDNISDADKPVSTAQQAALDFKVAKAGDTMTGLLALAAGAAGVGGITVGADTNLYRQAASKLKTDSQFLALSVTVTTTGATQPGYKSLVTGDVQNRFSADTSGKMLWGDGAVGGDTNLYRSAADTLKTDDALIVVGTLSGSTVTSAAGGATSLQLTNAGLKAVGTNAAQNLYLQAKGAAAVIVNGVSGDGTSGLTVWSGGASPTLGVYIDGTGNGKIYFGAAFDTNLYRSAADTLKTDDALVITRAFVGTLLSMTNNDAGGHGIVITLGAASGLVLRAGTTADVQNRFIIDASGKLLWGDGALAGDTNLYRSAADTLKTDDALIVTGVLTAPTAAPGTNSTQVATTAFVAAASGGGSGSFVSSAKWGSD